MRNESIQELYIIQQHTGAHMHNKKEKTIKHRQGHACTKKYTHTHSISITG